METNNSPTDISCREHSYNVRMTMKICNEIAELDKEIALKTKILESLQDQKQTLIDLLTVYSR